MQRYAFNFIRYIIQLGGIIVNILVSRPAIRKYENSYQN